MGRTDHHVRPIEDNVVWKISHWDGKCDTIGYRGGIFVVFEGYHHDRRRWKVDRAMDGRSRWTRL